MKALTHIVTKGIIALFLILVVCNKNHAQDIYQLWEGQEKPEVSRWFSVPNRWRSLIRKCVRKRYLHVG